MSTALVLGGLGQDISRQLVTHLYDSHSEIEFIRVVDKYLILPDSGAYTTYVDSACKAVLKDTSRVEYVQGNFMSQATLDKVFTLPPGDRYTGKTTFDYVFSFVGELEPDLGPTVYLERTLKLGYLVGKTAAHFKAPVFLQALQPYYHPTDKKGSVGKDASEPWGDSARWLHELGRLLATIDGLNLVLFRHGILYGRNTVTGVTRLCLLGEVYAHKKEQFDFLWSPELERHTVNIDDLSRGLVLAAQWAVKTSAQNRLNAVGESLTNALSKKEKEIVPKELATLLSKDVQAPVLTFVDSSNTTQGKIAKLLESVVGSGLKTHFLGTTTSLFAKLAMKDIVKEANETHLEGWSELLRKYKLDQSYPITPFFGSDILSSNALRFSSDKTKATIGWSPSKTLNTETANEGIASFISENLWPGK